MSDLTNSRIIFTLKMISVSKNTVRGLKMKSGLEKIFLKSLHAQSLFRKIFFTSWKSRFLPKLQIKMTFFAHGRISKKNCDACTYK
jgi:hypothetical protein